MFSLNGSIKFLVTIMFTFLAILVMSIYFMFLTSEEKTNDGEKWIAHTNQVISQSSSFLASMVDAETGQREFLLTLNESYLKPYYKGTEQAYIHFNKLKNLTRNNISQQLRLAQIKLLLDSKFAELKTTIDLADDGKKDEAMIIVKQDIGKKDMDNLRAILSQFITEEELLLTERKKNLASDINFIDKLEIGAGVLLFLTFVLISLFIHKKLINPILALTTKVKGVTNTVSSSSSSSSSEIHALSNAIEIMKTQIQKSTWIQDGISNLNNTLSGNLTTSEISSKSLYFLCNYLHAGVGSIYIPNEDAKILSRTAMYAYNEMKEGNKVIKIGEGIIGQVALQKSPIHLENILDSNLLISTGSTAVTPLEVHVFPLLYQGQLYGVIELGTSTILDDKSLDFLSLANDTIATFLLTARQTQNVQELLNKSEKTNLFMTQQQNALDSHSIVGITDVRGTITYANTKFSEVSGYSNEELIGANHRLVNSGTYNDGFWDDMYKTVANGEVWHHPAIKNKAKDGSTYWVDTTIFPFMDAAGKPESYIAIRTDVTKNKAAEDELREAKEDAEIAAVSKSDFLASMSHEIRTPMNGVIGMLDLLSRERLSKEQRDHVAIADASAKSLLNVINDILDFSKIEAGKVELEHIEFDLKQELGNFAKSIAITIANDDVELLLDLSELKHSFVYGDIERVKQILNNLVGNAIKFTHNGNIVLKASLSPANNKQTQLLVSVQDSGIGISQEAQVTLFEAFTQADSSTTRKYGGTGLGLSIAKNLVEHMGGELQVASVEGEGSTFSFSIDVELSSTQPHTMQSTDIRGKEILIVDDNDVNIKILSSQLRAWDIKVTSAFSAKEAISHCNDRAKDNPFDIAILDMQMPETDGETLGEELSNMPICKDMKMIIMTSYGKHKNLQRLYDKGFDAFFMKPTTASDLYDSLMVLANSSHPINEEKKLPTKDKLNSMIPIEIDNPQNINILLIEDNPTNQIVADSMLKNLGLKADIANNGQEAIDILKSADKTYDLLLMDCQMPVLDGFQTTVHLRKGACGEAYTNVPVIAMTANAMEGDKEKCLSFGMSDYISKPVVSEVLKETILRWVSQEDDAPEDKLPSWDKKEVLERLGGSQEILNKVMEVFLNDITTQTNKLKEALSTNNKDEIKLHAHTIKGSSGNLSALNLQEMAKSIEYGSKTMPLEELTKTFSLLEKESKEVIKLFKKHLDEENNAKENDVTISKEELKTALQELKESLVNGDFIDSKEHVLFSSSFNESVTEKMKKLKTSIDNFINDQALQVIDEILQEIGETNG